LALSHSPSQEGKDIATVSEFREEHACSLAVEWVNLEFCSLCNLNCQWCSLDHDKPRVFMTTDILVKVLDEVITDKGFRLDRIELHNGGETLLHPGLAAMLHVIAERKNQLPVINLLTNAAALTDNKARLLIDSEAVDVIRFSVDGGSRTDFERIRTPARWEHIRGNIARFLDRNDRAARRIRTSVICMVPPDRALETGWMEREFQELFARIDDVGIRHPHNWDGSRELGIDDIDYRHHASLSSGKICKFLIKNLVVLPDGDVTVCCADLNSRGVVGNVIDYTLRELYLSAKRQRMLRMFEAGRKAEIDLCKDCTGYYT
jgi:radical SAM protein with 4Fe4S-binding SPASM domain